MVKVIETIATYGMLLSFILFFLGVVVLLVGNFGVPEWNKPVRGCGIIGVAVVLFFLMGFVLLATSYYH